MVIAYLEPPAIRPTCPLHPGSRILLDGYFPCGWNDVHRRPRYRCVSEPNTRGHGFSLPVPVRQPSDHHPDSGRSCPSCEHVFARHEGVKTGAGFVFGHQEIARLFLRLGEGMSLREASTELRRSVYRVNHRDPEKPKLTTISPGQTSRQANLAVNYLDAFAPAILDALHPKRWPRVIVIDSTTLMTRGYRRSDEEEREERAKATDAAEDETRAGNLKAGTILVALEAVGRTAKPILMRAYGGKDVESWKEFFATLEGEPEWVIADLDWAISRAVRETWPKAILFHSRHHIAQLMRKCAIKDGIPERARLEEPIELSRPIPWSSPRSTLKVWGNHPLFTAIANAQRGDQQWDELLAQINTHVPADKLALRSWVETHRILISRQSRLAKAHHGIPFSTGAVEGKVIEWLAPLKRRAGRWQNVRRLNLFLGLIVLRGRGEAHEARYTRLVREQFEARGNRSHLESENTLPEEERDGELRQMSWWRSWQDREESSLSRLVIESELRNRQREREDDARLARERLTRRYEEEDLLRLQLGIPKPPKGRPKQPNQPPASVKGKFLGEFTDLMLEWDWDLNEDLAPWTLPAGTHIRVAWRCLLNPAHVWETRVSDRTSNAAACPYHMRVRVHPSESLAAYYPWLAKQWHPTKNTLRPDQVSHASARRIEWICEFGHEWPASVYQRTLSKTGCPDCHKIESGARTKAGVMRGQAEREAQVEAQIQGLIPLDEFDAGPGF